VNDATLTRYLALQGEEVHSRGKGGRNAGGQEIRGIPEVNADALIRVT
jgi:hypothetical protein